LLCPWDLVAELDWRTGVPAQPIVREEAVAEAESVMDQMLDRRPIASFYLSAPLPPCGLTSTESEAIALTLQEGVASRGVRILSGLFGLGAYLSTGCPLAGSKLGLTAQSIVDSVLAFGSGPKKVLVTDLDDTLWSGVLGEDGLDGIQAAPKGVGFRHFLYQTLLRKLKESGILLAVVSRNDPAIVASALAPGRMTLEQADFVAVLASYHPKSVQIAELARKLNLGLDQFVFVDDNPVELEEVRGALQDVECIAFPSDEDGILGLFDRLHHLFGVDEITDEDRHRTELYHRMTSAAVPVAGCPFDLTSYLSGLDMTLAINDRSRGDRSRALQLMNKTNQFNLNGRRWDDGEVETLLASGGQLFTAALTDRTGDHGEILAVLIDVENIVRALVMSCRVFQRQVEYAFMLWLLERVCGDKDILRFQAQRTSCNEPIWQFLEDSSFAFCNDGVLVLDAPTFREHHNERLQLFRLQ